MNPFQAVFAPLCGAVAIWFLTLMLRGKLPRRQCLGWFLVWGLAGVSIATPKAASSLAVFLGIGRGSDLVFYFAILAGLSACVYFYNRYRSLEISVAELTRQHAIDHARKGQVQIARTRREIPSEIE